jgi:FeS assembly SUF system regulator
MIKLSRLTDYAVTLLTQMVNERKSVWSAADLAEKSDLPMPTVAKILKQLAKSEIICAHRGAAGGYRLARAPMDIPIISIIEAMDGPITMTNCAKEGDSHCRIEKICPANGNWNKVNRVIRDALQAVSLADMAQSPSPRDEEPVHLARMGHMS